MKKDLAQKTLDFHDDPEIYDAINNFDYDIKFWKRWCQSAGKSVLELCCGTGRVGIPLIKAGFHYTGIDISRPFLKSAKDKTCGLNGNYAFQYGDMRTFKLKKKFDSVLIPFNALAHLYSYKDVEACFQSVREHLRKNGLFIFNIFNPNPHYLVRDPRKRYRFTYEFFKTKSGKLFTLSENNLYDRSTQINHIKWYYKIKGHKKEVEKDLTMRMFYPEELLALLDYNGFEVVKRLEDFSGRAFKANSVMQIIIAKQKHRPQKC